MSSLTSQAPVQAPVQAPAPIHVQVPSQVANDPNEEEEKILSAEDMVKAHKEYEQRIRELDDDNIDFAVNVNNIIGNPGPYNFLSAINAISTALFVLQKENSPRHTLNINLLANRILETHCQTPYKLNRAEIISYLYYIQQNMETITLNSDSDILMWSIRDDLFKNLCED